MKEFLGMMRGKRAQIAEWEQREHKTKAGHYSSLAAFSLQPPQQRAPDC